MVLSAVIGKLQHKRVVLASASPRRREILNNAVNWPRPGSQPREHGRAEGLRPQERAARRKGTRRGRGLRVVDGNLTGGGA